ncbi:hypothetical protein AK830_g1284 [Neonectria ditissima]|uniref:Uncharacterized protein n=1 Tax=Neonectria ditissima TaxID=78410 RepID=A0A0P7BX77_9HYPO|nr:hypothetical protein AK830_g1284 [Neonectria ditissima]
MSQSHLNVDDRTELPSPREVIEDSNSTISKSPYTIIIVLISILFFAVPIKLAAPAVASIVLPLRLFFPRAKPPTGLVLITGASSDVGAELGYVFAERGHDLILVGQDDEQLQAVKNNVEGKGGPSARIAYLLIQSTLRNNDISFDPFLFEFSKGIFGQDDRQVVIIQRIMKELLDIIHSTLSGEPLHKLNTTALTHLMKNLNRIQPTESVRVPNAYLWIRNMTTEATMMALFGEKNPITPENVHHLWTFDESATLLAIGVAPNLIARKSVAARNKLNKLLLPYYEAEDDQRPDVSEVIRKRAALLRREGYNAVDLSIQEILLP